ncbi:Glycosyl hydrolase 5 family protein [Bienertia sinuspersici]
MAKKLLVQNSFMSTILLLLTFFLATSHALPLSTNTRWFVDQHGQRVKLACVNWSSHLQLAVAEGLSKRPVDVISKNITDMGFNCVRLTWPLYLATNKTLGSLSVRESFNDAGLVDAFNEFQDNNPSLVDVSLIDAFKAVVKSLAKKKVMVILDNHLSKPGWCCNYDDENGFFGDKYFKDPQLWIRGLTKMATLFKGHRNVVAMTRAVHKANPNVVVIISGLNFDTNLSFLRKKPVSLHFTNKLAFEVHRYAFSGKKTEWEDGNPNEVCGKLTKTLKNNAGFLVERGFPIFVGEWGLNLNDTKKGEKLFSDCFLAWLVEHDLDWALWTMAGSYYIKEGVVGAIETFGLFNWNWTQIRNEPFLHKIAAIQSPHIGPKAIPESQHKIIFHPSTGLCVLNKGLLGLQLGDCSYSTYWTYTHHKTIGLKGSYNYVCLKAQELDRPASLGLYNCFSGEGTRWAPISASKLHLATKLSNNQTVCLDVDAENKVITSTCKCLSKDNKCDPGSQWFKIADASAIYTSS